jgi:predicted transposase/invertase (TIGR01784 family)
VPDTFQLKDSIFYATIASMERLNPLNDYLFLKFMGEEGDEEQCLAFLNAVLGSKGKKPVKLIKILENKTFIADVIGEKTSILDVRAETDIGEKINIEVQLKDLHNMEKRTLQHWGREFTKGISAGDDYKDLPKVITINIVNFDNIKLDDFHTCFHLWEDDHHDYLLTDVLEIHFINMVKFRKLKNRDISNNPLERWLTFLDITTPEKTLQEVIQMDGAINKAYDRLNFVSQDKEVLRAYEMREMAMSDWTTGLNTAEEKGHMRAQLEIAKNLKKIGLSVAQIAEGTGLDIETIQSLQ